MDQKKLPIGVDDFQELIEGNYYYVDKSLLIKELLDARAKATLLPRPRRFGKTLNLSMLRYFFEKTEVSRRHLFNGLAIEQHPDCMKHQGQYPIIFLTFKDVKEGDWEEIFSAIKDVIAEEFDRHGYLAASPAISELQRKKFRLVLDGEGTTTDYKSSLRLLSACLHKHYQKRPIILIDEYDAPIHAGYLNDYYKEVIGFMRGFLGGGLKGNNSAEFSVVTGILRVAKESIFSGINNLRVCTLMSDHFADKFGLTEKEVEQALHDFALKNSVADLRAWYDGYLFGQGRVYNPWSIFNFIDAGGKLQPYWVNTSDNLLIQSLVKQAPDAFKDEVELLMRGGTVKKQINENIILPQLTYDQSVFWNFLLFCGYLTFENYRLEGIFYFADLKIPNNEILSVYHTIVLSWFKAPGIHQDYLTMLTKLVDGDAVGFKRLFESFSKEALGHFDVAGDEPERFYHALTIGMFAALYFTHEVKSNREAGLGRYDVMLVPKDSAKPSILFEFKKVPKGSKKSAKTVAQEALDQIATREYEIDLRARGITNIIKLGIGFNGKESLVLIGANPK